MIIPSGFVQSHESKRGSPLLLRLKLPTVVTGVRPIDFPFEVFFLGDQAGLFFFHAEQPFLYKAVEDAAGEPHTHGRVRGPIVGVVIVHARIVAFVAFLAWGISEAERA